MLAASQFASRARALATLKSLKAYASVNDLGSTLHESTARMTDCCRVESLHLLEITTATYVVVVTVSNNWPFGLPWQQNLQLSLCQQDMSGLDQ